MSALPKIVIGGLATTAAAWLLHGPLGLGAKCAAGAAPAGLGTVTGAIGNGASAIADASGAAIGGVANTADAAASGLANATANTAAAVGAAATTMATPAAVGACQDKVTRAASAGTIHFQTGGAAVAGGSSALLDGIASAIRDCAGVAVEIGGHTDAQGDAAANQALSERRAEAVLAALVNRGVPAGRLTARGFGETRLLHADGPENDPRNRRIEFTVSAAPAR